MVVSIRSQAPVSTSVKSLVKGFVLTQRTDCKSPRTIEYYESNLRRFLWYADQQEWPDDVRLIIDIERIDYIRNSINAVRNDLPDGAVEAEKKSESHGRQPALVS